MNPSHQTETDGADSCDVLDERSLVVIERILEFVFSASKQRRGLLPRALVVGWLLRPGAFGRCTLEALAKRHGVPVKSLRDQLAAFRVEFGLDSPRGTPARGKESIQTFPHAGERAIPD